MALDAENKRTVYRLGWIMAAVILVIFGMILHSSGNNHASNPAASTPEAPTVAAAPPLKVSAPKLYRDYQRNEVSADTMYRAKTLAVTGRVSSISKDFTDGVYLTLDNGENEFSGVHADLQKSETDKASVLSKGTVVTVVCEGGGMIIGTPNLKDCLIQ
jgi:hypothetical protein